DTGFTPAAFTLNNGQSYTIQVDDYGSSHFDHWADTGSTSASRSISITSNAQLTAVYNCGGTMSSSATVQPVDQDGSAITGYYNVLYDQNGNRVGNGFTPTTYSPLTTGQNYTLLVENYGSC